MRIKSKKHQNISLHQVRAIVPTPVGRLDLIPPTPKTDPTPIERVSTGFTTDPQPRKNHVLELRRVVNGRQTVVEKDTHIYKDNKLEELYPNYQVRFAIVNPLDVLNMCGPEFNYRPHSWDDPLEREKRFHVGRRYVESMNAQIGFYSKLEESILNEGFLNPIVITTGYPKFRSIEEVPPELRVRPTDMMVCELIGGSRLLIAQKHQMLVPAIINDFTGAFDDAPLLVNQAEVAAYFTHPPKDILFTNRGLRLTPPAHTHLDESAHNPRVVMDIRRHAIKQAYE